MLFVHPANYPAKPDGYIPGKVSVAMAFVVVGAVALVVPVAVTTVPTHCHCCKFLSEYFKQWHGS